MTLALLIVAMLVAAGVCVVQLRKRHGYLTYPLLAAVFYLAWLAPQLYGVLNAPLLPREGLWSLSVMVLASLATVLAGWSLGQRQAKARLKRKGGLDLARFPTASALVAPTVALTAIAFGTRILLNGMRLDPNLTTQWTGPIVIVFTLAAIRIIPLFLSLVMVLERRSPITLGLAAANLLLSGSFAFVDIGRSETIDLVLVTFLALWFARRIRVGLPVLVAGGVAVAIFVFTVGEFRSAASKHFDITGERVSIFNPQVWRNIDFEEASVKAVEGAPDLRNAVFLMTFREVQGGFTLGTRFWDDFIFRWVPAQIVGKEIKSSLMFRKDQDQDAVFDDILNQYDYERTVGTTSTGFGIAYSEFWYFGALLFGVYAWFAGRWWTLGSEGDLWAQVMYASTLGSGLIAFTHDVYWVWLDLPLLLGGVAFVRLWLWATSPERRRTPQLARDFQPAIPAAGARALQGALSRHFTAPL